jgi:hypothetical protein
VEPYPADHPALIVDFPAKYVAHYLFFGGENRNDVDDECDDDAFPTKS